MSYADLLIRQYRQKPRARATAELISNEFASTWHGLAELRSVLDIDKAEKANLDLVGKHVGQSRVLPGLVEKYGLSTVLQDEDYRFLIKCRIARNYMVGTAPNMEDALDFIFGTDAEVFDNYDMSYTVIIRAPMISEFKRIAITELDILPRPVGVRVRYNLITRIPFGFGESYENFENGTFGVPAER